MEGWYVWKGGTCRRVVCVEGWYVCKGGVCKGGVSGRVVCGVEGWCVCKVVCV